MSKKKDSTYILIWAKKIKALSFLGGKCYCCGENRVPVLDFHHKDKEEKNFCINKIKDFRWSIIEKELEKCIILCRNCHAEIHCNYDIFVKHDKYRKIKKKLLEIKGTVSCAQCNYTSKNSLASLEFHHDSDKKLLLSQSHAYKWEDVLLELDKCLVLCRNCHALRHFDIDRFKKAESQILEKVKNYKELRPKINRKIIQDLLDKGKRQVEIVKILGCSKSTISDMICKHQVLKTPLSKAEQKDNRSKAAFKAWATRRLSAKTPTIKMGDEP